MTGKPGPRMPALTANVKTPVVAPCRPVTRRRCGRRGAVFRRRRLAARGGISSGRSTLVEYLRSEGLRRGIFGVTIVGDFEGSAL